MTKYHFHQNIS